VGEDSLPDGNAYVDEVRDIADEDEAEVVVISAEIESQIAEFDDPDERIMFLDELGLNTPGLERLIRAAFDLLGLITFFTAGPKEARAWTIRQGTKAPQAAGTIHSDFERGFIRAKTIHFTDYVKAGSESAARDAGVMRAEGKDYEVKDGDVMLFRFNV
jgi:ribosome-binding ATPase YchF (GTP1/OBG family)